MKITSIVSQNRRDFTAIYECEGCGETVRKGGYDDRNFHDNVVPNMECSNCGKSRNDMGVTGERVETKYPSWMNV